MTRYLDSIIHFAYVLLRNLESYSKSQKFMYVRKRKAARRKRKQNETGATQPSIPEEYVGEGEGDEEPDRDTPSYAEHQFTFASFEKVSTSFAWNDLSSSMCFAAFRPRSGRQYPCDLSLTFPRLL